MQERGRCHPCAWQAAPAFSLADLDATIALALPLMHGQAEPPVASILALVTDVTYGTQLTSSRDRAALETLARNFLQLDADIAGLHQALPSGDLAAYR